MTHQASGGSLSLFSSDERILSLDYEELKQKSVRDQETIEFLSGEVRWLKEQLRAAHREKFGKKSERWESPEQLVFNEAEMESEKPDPSLDDEADDQSKTTVAGHTRKARGYRRPLPEELPREIIKIELAPEERIAADGTPLKIIGWEKSEKLKYEPAKMSVIEYHRAKYGADSGDYEKSAPPLPMIIPKGIATPELLAAITVGKYADSLPLYRMEEIFRRHGIDMNRGTMSRWMIKLAEALQPIWNVLSEKLLSSFYAACDETHVQVLKENGRSAESKSWMWVRSTPYGEKKVVLFDYNPSRAGEVAKDLFLDFKGTLQTDGLSVYNALEKQEGVERIGCNMHGRRRFEKAVVTGAKEGKSLGEKGLKFYKRIYDIEEDLKDKTPDERKRLRDDLSRPVWDEFKAWIDEMKIEVPRKSKIGDAFAYMDSQFSQLTGYLKDGRLNCDNGFTERAIRKFAIGRNNWMFSDTEHGAHASALLYSLVVTAKVNGVNPYRALVKMFDELPRAKNIDDYERLAEFILSPEASA